MVACLSSKVLLVGGGGREDAIARQITASGAELFSALKNRNPSIIARSREHLIVDELDYRAIANFAVSRGVDLVFIGPDPVLDTPLADSLRETGLKVASPSRRAAKIETSKAYMRDLMDRHRIQGNIESHLVSGHDELERLILNGTEEYAVKPIGLTGGKGVKVMGIQLNGRSEAYEYAREILSRDGQVLLEERISGEEFSQMVFTDGTHVIPMPLAQDFKRAYEGDQGPNTGGMGSITDRDHLLPFVDSQTREKSLSILSSILGAMRNEGTPFVGVMYGQFMATREGPKVVEVNARFADPEGINVLSIMDGDFAELIFSMAEGNLRNTVNFRKMATVLKYIVPPGYGTNPAPGTLEIDAGLETDKLMLYYAAVSGTMNRVNMSGSRALALVGLAESICQASDIVEAALPKIHGNYYVRHDIGSREMMEKKIRRP